MDVSEPTGYENEPDEVFLPLPRELYPAVFHLEMENNTEDCEFYRQVLSGDQCRTVLELGCGTGRIQESLWSRHFNTIGIDYSRDMLMHRRDARTASTVEMDMRHLGFKPVFDAVLIPYNTLNLLQDRNDIVQCLNEVKSVLTGPSSLLLHLFTPDSQLVRHPGQRHFQFSLFDLGTRKKLVKETVRIYSPDTSTLALEERYKFRSFDNPQENTNYTCTLTLAAFPFSVWRDILTGCGFTIVQSYADFSYTPFISGESNRLIIKARKE